MVETILVFDKDNMHCNRLVNYYFNVISWFTKKKKKTSWYIQLVYAYIYIAPVVGTWSKLLTTSGHGLGQPQP